jgi:hypothetical protein
MANLGVFDVTDLRRGAKTCSLDVCLCQVCLWRLVTDCSRCNKAIPKRFKLMRTRPPDVKACCLINYQFQVSLCVRIHLR